MGYHFGRKNDISERKWRQKSKLINKTEKEIEDEANSLMTDFLVSLFIFKDIIKMRKELENKDVKDYNWEELIEFVEDLYKDEENKKIKSF